jgi:D-serine deaminase-like pyridoxal phosphate-dependent protein
MDIERGTKVEDLDTPALLLDLEVLEDNIRGMADYFHNKPTKMRPHIKTHKCPLIAHKQILAGAEGIACQKLGEAEVMVESGIHDVLITNQVVGWEKILRLAKLAHHSTITVLADNAENVRQLSKTAQQEGVQLGVLEEVNVGMNRCGVPPGDGAIELAREISKSESLNFRGILGYEGHCVLIDDFERKKSLCLEAMAKNIDTRNRLEQSGLRVESVRAGGTSTYDIAGTYPGITEVHPGTYATMDAKFKNMGIPFGYAVTLLTSVISNPNRGKYTLNAGMKAISPEYGLPQPKSEGLRVTHLYEEHALVEDKTPENHLKIGDKLELVPTHGCTTINLHDEFHCVRNGYLEAVWKISARGKFS